MIFSSISKEMMINVSKSERIESWNLDLAHVLIPNIFILAIYTCLGICGNATVIYVYKVRFSGKNVDRYFIPYLAVVDLLASSVCGSFGIATNMMQATFYNDSLCKAWWFFAALTTFVSIMMLLPIAVQRYLKVVRPLGRQMDIKLNRIALLLVISISLLFAIPIPILYGSVPFPHAREDIVGQRCSRLKDGTNAFSLIYGISIGLVAIATIVALFGIYLRIGWTIFKHMKYGNELMRNDKETKKTSVEDPKLNMGNEYKRCRAIDPGNGENNLENEGRTSDKQGNDNKGVKKGSRNNQHEKINLKIMHKFTLMFMLITMIFLICYIPKAFIMLFEALTPNFWESFSDRDRAGMLFIYRMYIINKISNPFVYAFLDLKFRNELKSICCRRK